MDDVARLLADGVGNIQHLPKCPCTPWPVWDWADEGHACSTVLAPP